MSNGRTPEQPGALKKDRIANFLNALVASADAKARLKRADFFQLYCSRFKVNRERAKKALPIFEDMSILHNGHHGIRVLS